MPSAQSPILKSLLSLSFLLAMMVTTGACGDDGGGGAESCSFDNCSGCCDGTECKTTTSTLFCGQAGASCNSCDSGEICSAGTCTQEADCSQCQTSGCCLNGTQCMDGDTAQACGKDGNACESCSGDGVVCGPTSNICEATTCDSDTCSDGCCTSNGECLKNVGQSKDACGTGGDACEVCDSTDLSCTSGACVPMGTTCLDFCADGCCMGETCVDVKMQDNAACGTAVVCAACTGSDNCAQGTCAVGAAWVITIVSATIADTNLDGNDWDGGLTLPASRPPDPEVAGGLGGQAADDFLTPFQPNTLMPVWDYTAGSYGQADLIAEGLFLVFTDDDVAFDDPMGECTVIVTPTDLAAGTKTQATCGASVTDLVINFAPVQ